MLGWGGKTRAAVAIVLAPGGERVTGSVEIPWVGKIRVICGVDDIAAKVSDRVDIHEALGKLMGEVADGKALAFPIEQEDPTYASWTERGR